MEIRGLRLRHIASYLLAPLMPLLLLTACRQDDSSDASATTGEQMALLDIQTSIADASTGSATNSKDVSSEVRSRSVVTGTSLAENGRTYGIIVCKHEDTPTNYEIYDNAKLYKNIQAWYGNYNNKGTMWWYSYEKNSGAYLQPLYLVSNDDNDHLDIYAYSPWKSGTTLTGGFEYNLTSVSQDGIVDPMYATYDGNTDLAIAEGTTLTPKITFHHALARIVFHLKLANAQNTGLDGYHALRLYQIQMTHKDGAATPLYTSGRMNLLTGDVTSLQTATQQDQTVTYATGMNTYGIDGWDIYQSDTYRTYNMLVHPTTYQTDGDFTLKFWFNGTGSSQTLINTYDIKRSDLLHSDGTYGFQPGYCYHFYFVIDNYIHLQNVHIDREWTNTDEEEIKV